METRLLTYEELGAALNITPASAKRLAIRRKWAKKPGNDGKSRVAVPVERLAVKPPPVTGDSTSDDTDGDTSDSTGDGAGDRSDIPSVVSVLSRHIERLEMQLTAVIAKLTTVEYERDAERQRLEAERDAERQRANELALQAATVEPLRETVQFLKLALEGDKHRIREVQQERDRWHKLAMTPRGFWGWLRRFG